MKTLLQSTLLLLVLFSKPSFGQGLLNPANIRDVHLYHSHNGVIITSDTADYIQAYQLSSGALATTPLQLTDKIDALLGFTANKFIVHREEVYGVAKAGTTTFTPLPDCDTLWHSQLDTEEKLAFYNKAGKNSRINLSTGITATAFEPLKVTGYYGAASQYGAMYQLQNQKVKVVGNNTEFESIDVMPIKSFLGVLTNQLDLYTYANPSTSLATVSLLATNREHYRKIVAASETGELLLSANYNINVNDQRTEAEIDGKVYRVSTSEPIPGGGAAQTNLVVKLSYVYNNSTDNIVVTEDYQPGNGYRLKVKAEPPYRYYKVKNNGVTEVGAYDSVVLTGNPDFFFGRLAGVWKFYTLKSGALPPQAIGFDNKHSIESIRYSKFITANYFMVQLADTNYVMQIRTNATKDTLYEVYNAEKNTYKMVNDELLILKTVNGIKAVWFKGQVSSKMISAGPSVELNDIDAIGPGYFTVRHAMDNTTVHYYEFDNGTGVLSSTDIFAGKQFNLCGGTTDEINKVEAFRDFIALDSGTKRYAQSIVRMKKSGRKCQVIWEMDSQAPAIISCFIQIENYE